MRNSKLAVATVRRFASALAVLAAMSCAKDRGEQAAAAESVVAWSPSVSLTEKSGGGAAPVLAKSSNGQVTLAWVSAPNGGKDGRLYAQSGVQAAIATSPAELRDPAGSLSIYGEVPPKIAYGGDGTLYASYLVTRAVPGQRWPQNLLRFSVSADGGAHWSAPTTVTGDTAFGSYSDHALSVAPNGTLYLSWLSVAGADTSHTYFARSTDGGKSWAKPLVVDQDRSCPCCRTAMAVGPDGALYLAWRKRFALAGGEEERDIVLARSTDGGKTWSRPARVHADGWRVNYCPDAGPSVKVSADGTVHVAWWTGKPGNAGTQYTKSTDGGRTFSAPVALGIAAQSRASHIQLELGDSAHASYVVAAWDDGTRQVPQITVRVSRDGGQTFGSADRISAPERQAGYPVVALRHDSVFVAWQERSLAAAAADSVEQARMPMDDANRMINAVGAMQVVTRAGVISRDGANR